MSEATGAPGQRGTGKTRIAQWVIVAIVVAVPRCLGAPVALLAQQPDTALQASQQRLQEIRRERQQLQGDMDRLRGRVHNLSSELTNIDRQLQLSGRVVGELDIQVAAMGSQIDRTTADLIVAEDALTEKRAILQHRLVEISKRGPLYTFQVLLAAESFGDLLSRYKYLYLATRQDRQLVTDVEDLRDRVADQRDSLLHRRSTLADLRDERAEETERLQILERQREESLRDSRREQARVQQRLEQLERDEARISNFIASLERRRRAAAAANPRAAPAPARLRTADMGRLEWPVEGDILYSFGRAAGPGNTTVRWNGIGIGAAVGTPVRSIGAGTARIVGPLGTYGLSVLVDHGGGLWSLYGNLQSADVRQDQAIERNQVIGRTGGENSDEGPHLHFEIRGQDGQAVDPVQWLRRRG